MSSKLDQVKVLERCQISPPPNSVPTTSCPLTFLDIPWMVCCPMQRVFFYQVPFSSAQFTDEVLPQLKNSLSLALQRFFPFCGHLVSPPPPNEPHILYKDGDSVPLLAAQSFKAFDDLLSDGPKDATDLHLLVPPIPPTYLSDDTLTELTPLLALQVTLFPNSSLCIGIKFRHTVADAWSFSHFVKTWASIFKANCDMSDVLISSPVHDKSVLKDPDGLKYMVLNNWRAWGSPIWKGTVAPKEDNVRATFTLSRFEIERLKKWIAKKLHNGTDTTPKLHLSSYVVTSAFIWVYTVKSLDAITADDSSKLADELCHFSVVADCRNRYNLGIPATFFGNCLIGNLVSVARNKFTQEESVATAAEAISQCVQSFTCGKVLEGYQIALSKFEEVIRRGEFILTVASSPKIAAYETDFGWGQPAKTECVHIDISGAISLSESKMDKGGMEVGICRSRHEMDIFTSLFQAGLKQFL